jgi:RNA polymerase sigma factor (sigma-70 family)
VTLTTTITGDSEEQPASAAAVGAELARRVLAGDVAAEDQLVRHYQRGVLMILRRAMRDDELARDLCQDTFVIVLKRLRAAPLDDPTRVGGFIMQTARNLAIGEHRRGARRRTDTDSVAIDEAADLQQAHAAQQSEAESSANAVRKLLTELKSERDRIAIVRYYLDEDSREAICAQLGMTELQFNVVLFRARERLRQILEHRGLRKSDLLCLALV